MLLDHFDNNPKFLEEGKSLTIKFKKEIITLQLATDQGCQPLEDELMVGEWKLTPEDNLTVSFASIVYLTMTILCTCCICFKLNM